MSPNTAFLNIEAPLSIAAPMNGVHLPAAESAARSRNLFPLTPCEVSAHYTIIVSAHYISSEEELWHLR